MNVQYNVNDKKMMKLLSCSKRFQKYPSMFLNDTCKVIVNNDDYLSNDEFILKSKYKNLPRQMFIYGKKQGRNTDENFLYLNYWMEIFLKTIEKGILCKTDFNKSNSKLDLCIGIPLSYRASAFNYNNWQRKDIIDFLSCLFDCDLYEVNYEQQDLFENLLVA